MVVLELEIDQAVAELPTALEAAEPVTAQVVAEQERDQVEAVPLIDHPRVQLGVALGTKSVIAAHLPDLPLLAGAVDLAVVAETTREPAATGVAAAWAAVVTVVAAAGIAVAAE
ncbi:MAG: hypothetical protein J2P56_07475 [Verrucomicrobia bacterium]|nr:hypothetical protein [Verrucomicrobiota bacterium]